jgi:hypothetical protein
MANFHAQDSGVFFVSMLVQVACLSLCSNLVRLPDIVSAYFSPWLSHYRRKYINDSQDWRRQDGVIFAFGQNYAQQLVIMAIVVVFSTTVPMTGICGLIFFSMRHIVDSYNILTVNRKEIESSTKLIRTVLFNFQVGVVLAQLTMISYLVANSY